MSFFPRVCLFIIAFGLVSLVGPSAFGQEIDSRAKTFRIHPDHPHFFEYRSRPTVLITSGEHYGAVLNLDSDYRTYLQTLSQDGLNYTRIFTGTYVEVPGNFGITKNTLAPATGRFLAPWARTESSSRFEGEAKLDLSRWNQEYFKRLQDFLRCAQDNGVIVEVTLFCSTYADDSWERHPFNPGNHINGVQRKLERRDSTTLRNGSLIGIQKRFVEKIVREVNEFDNVFFEIQNEPWADNGVYVDRVLKTVFPKKTGGDWFKWAEVADTASKEWQQAIAETIVKTESQLPKRHLIAQNYCNFQHSLPAVSQDVSILNFHYAWPEVVATNWGWNRPIGFDESGFSGTDDGEYLRQAWRFVLSGGALFNHLDYSFFVGAETGDGKNDAPGGGGTRFRKRLGYLKKFIESFEFVRLTPDATVVAHAPGFLWNACSEPGRQYAICLTGIGSEGIDLRLPDGQYQFEIVSPLRGESITSGDIKSAGPENVTRLPIPDEPEMVAIKLLAK